MRLLKLASAFVLFLSCNSLLAQTQSGNAIPTHGDRGSITAAGDTSLLDTCSCNVFNRWYKEWKANGSVGGKPDGYNLFVRTKFAAPDTIRNSYYLFKLCLDALNTSEEHANDDTLGTYWNAEATEQIEFFAMNFKAYTPSFMSCAGGGAGIDPLAQEKAIKIYPNPVIQGSQVVINVSDLSSGLIRVYNTQGKIIQTRSFGPNSGYILLDNDLSAGMYLVQVISKNKNLTSRLIVR
jgi:hypothetical protein